MCEPCGGPCKYGEGGKVYDVGSSETIPAKERGIMKESYAEGGDVDSDGDYHNELMDQCCDELLSAIESKNKKEMLDSLKAIILSCKE